MERAFIVLGLDKRISSVDEVHKSILIGSVEISIIPVSYVDGNVHRVDFSKLFEERELMRKGKRKASHGGRAYVARMVFLMKLEFATA